jgi:tripartite-type tricarboxylate transporter receptor subunit TctC
MRASHGKFPTLASVCCAVVGLLVTVTTCFAQNPADFYKGKQIRVVVGSAAGSGYDLVARLVWRYVANYIPGKPTIVIQNVPGAGSIVMANQVANSAPRDGTVIGAPINGMPTAPLLQPDATHFDPTKLLWIGAAARESQVAFAWHSAPVQSLEDLKTRELLVGATTAGTTMVDFPAVSNAFLGLKFKIVRGYEGTTQIFQAIEAGELQGVGGVGWSSVKLLAGKWLAQKQITIIAQYGFERVPALPDVPLVYDLAKTNEDRLALRLTFARQEYDRGYFLPPDVPAERVEILRRAFDTAMKDRDFLNEAQKSGIDIDPVSGERVGALIAQVLATPKDIAERVRTIIDGP